MRNILFLFLFTAFSLLPGYSTAEESESISDQFISHALQGNLSQAGILFENGKPESERLSDAGLATHFQTRFIEQNENLSPATGDVFADAVVVAYRNYWINSLMRESSEAEAEAYLETSLGDLLEDQGYEYTDKPSDNIHTVVGQALKSRGFYYLDTPAPPFRDLFLWRRQERKHYSVRLIDRTQKATVIFMSEIFSLGWKHFATLGLVSTTGWVEGDTLYCVGWAYDRSSENFEISYLKHESRHLADFEKFPGLLSVELEYRAKLTELSFAATSFRRLLDDFSRKSAVNPESPHGYANYRVTRDMFQEMFGETYPADGVEKVSPWQGSSARQVNLAARALLNRNTLLLEKNAE